MEKQNSTVKFGVPGFLGRSGVPGYSGVFGVLGCVLVFLVLVQCKCYPDNKLFSTYSLTSGGFPCVKLPSTIGTHMNTKLN